MYTVHVCTCVCIYGLSAVYVVRTCINGVCCFISENVCLVLDRNMVERVCIFNLIYSPHFSGGHAEV